MSSSESSESEREDTREQCAYCKHKYNELTIKDTDDEDYIYCCIFCKEKHNEEYDEEQQCAFCHYPFFPHQNKYLKTDPDDEKQYKYCSIDCQLKTPRRNYQGKDAKKQQAKDKKTKSKSTSKKSTATKKRKIVPKQEKTKKPKIDQDPFSFASTTIEI
jgi:hypothetical protein